MNVLGIDIGNAFCVVAAAGKHGVDVILNEESKRQTPACVALGARQRFLGAAAASPTPGTTAVSQIKRLIGRPMTDAGLKRDLATAFPNREVSEDDQGYPLLHFKYRGKDEKLSPTQLLGMLLGSLKRTAERNLSATVSDCCIAVPAYFNDAQRRAVHQAAEIAGLHPLRLLHESSAAALEYGIYRGDLPADGNNRAHVVAFVDVGHSATQVAIGIFRSKEVQILARAADPNLGGRDFDEALFNHFTAKLKADDPELDVSGNARASTRLRTACEKIKKVLSANPDASLNIECFMKDKDASALITREGFENLCEPLLQRIRQTIRDAFAVEPQLKPEHVNAVELIGSGSRVPAVVRVVDEMFGQESRRTLNASECIARGCALQAAMLNPVFEIKKFKILDKVPFGIDVSWNQAIPKGSTENPPRFHILTMEDGIPTSRALGMNVKLDASSYTRSLILRLDKLERFMPNAQSIDVPWKGTTLKVPRGLTEELHERRDGIRGPKQYGLRKEKNTFSFDLIYTEDPMLTLSTCKVGPFDLNQIGSIGLRIIYVLNRDGIVSVDSVTVLPGKEESSEPLQGTTEDDQMTGIEKISSPSKQKQSATIAVHHGEHVLTEERAEVKVPFIEHVHGAFSEDVLRAAKEKESKMVAWDKQVEMTKDQKNLLESYVLEMRNKLKNKYRDCVTESGRVEFMEKLQNAERWLYDEGEDVEHDAYAGRLKELKTLGNPIEIRFRESLERSAAFDRLQACVNDLVTFLHEDRPENRHIDNQEKQKAHALIQSECEEAMEWWNTVLAKQDARPKNIDPVVTVADIQSKINGLTKLKKLHMTSQGRETVRRKKALEFSVCDMIGKLSGEYEEFVSDEERQVFSDKLNQLMNWLHEEGEDADCDAYGSKMNELRMLADPIETRIQESSDREAAFLQLRCLIKDMSALTDRNTPDYPDIDNSEKQKVVAQIWKECCDCTHWMECTKEKLKTQPKYETPVVDAADIRAAKDRLVRLKSRYEEVSTVQSKSFKGKITSLIRGKFVPKDGKEKGLQLSVYSDQQQQLPQNPEYEERSRDSRPGDFQIEIKKGESPQSDYDARGLQLFHHINEAEDPQAPQDSCQRGNDNIFTCPNCGTKMMVRSSLPPVQSVGDEGNIFTCPNQQNDPQQYERGLATDVNYHPNTLSQAPLPNADARCGSSSYRNLVVA